MAQPANKYPPLQFQLFCDYPYSLPCLVGAGISLFSFVSKWIIEFKCIQIICCYKFVLYNIRIKILWYYSVSLLGVCGEREL